MAGTPKEDIKEIKKMMRFLKNRSGQPPNKGSNEDQPSPLLENPKQGSSSGPSAIDYLHILSILCIIAAIITAFALITAANPIGVGIAIGALLAVSAASYGMSVYMQKNIDKQNDPSTQPTSEIPSSQETAPKPPQTAPKPVELLSYSTPSKPQQVLKTEPDRTQGEEDSGKDRERPGR